MNSIQKNAGASAGPTLETYVSGFEKKLQETNDLPTVELMMKKLKFLGLHYDPFLGEVSSECQGVIEDLGLTLHLNNPYQATNILLRLLDKTEERLNNLKQ